MCCDYLKEKELLWARKQMLGRKWGLSIVSCGLNVPLELKRTEQYKQLCIRLSMELQEELCRRGYKIVCRERICGLCAYTLAVTQGEAIEIKRACIEFEDSAPIYRILDADVMRSDGVPISRRDLGLEERRCYLCGYPAKYCSALRRHSQKEVINEIDALVQNSNMLEQEPTSPPEASEKKRGS